MIQRILIDVTGQINAQGLSNNGQLVRMPDFCGPLTAKRLRKCLNQSTAKLQAGMFDGKSRGKTLNMTRNELTTFVEAMERGLEEEEKEARRVQAASKKKS